MRSVASQARACVAILDQYILVKDWPLKNLSIVIREGRCLPIMLGLDAAQFEALSQKLQADMRESDVQELNMLRRSTMLVVSDNDILRGKQDVAYALVQRLSMRSELDGLENNADDAQFLARLQKAVQWMLIADNMPLIVLKQIEQLRSLPTVLEETQGDLPNRSSTRMAEQVRKCNDSA